MALFLDCWCCFSGVKVCVYRGECPLLHSSSQLLSVSACHFRIENGILGNREPFFLLFLKSCGKVFETPLYFKGSSTGLETATVDAHRAPLIESCRSCFLLPESHWLVAVLSWLSSGYDPFLLNPFGIGEQTESPLPPSCFLQGTGKWYELQDLQVTDILPQMITLSEAYIQVGAGLLEAQACWGC